MRRKRVRGGGGAAESVISVGNLGVTEEEEAGRGITKVTSRLIRPFADDETRWMSAEGKDKKDKRRRRRQSALEQEERESAEH